MSHRKQRNRIIAGLVTLCGTGLGWVFAPELATRNAKAGDDKIFGPQFCVPLEPAGVGIGNAAFHAYEVEQNTQDDYQTFVCPLVRDSVTGTLEGVWVRLTNRNIAHDTPPICCIHSVSVSTVQQDFECQAVVNVAARMSLSFELDDFTEFDYGHYAVTCRLGGKDTIISIRTSESS